MSKKNRPHYAAEELKELLRKLPDEQAPASLSKTIMRRIQSQPLPLHRRIIDFFTAPRTFTMHPARLAGGCAALGFAFWLGMTMNVNNALTPQQGTGTHNLVMGRDQEIQKIFSQGRHLLIAGEEEEALSHLQEAGRRAPQNPEYAYYEGLAYQATDNLQLERASYQRGLQSETNSLPLLLNLGHNFLDSGELDAALAQYETVLALNPQESTALYNKGLIYQKKGLVNEEIQAWRQYLGHHRSGKWALRAVSHLNNQGDFSFRSYQIGVRKVILSQQALLGEDDSFGDRAKEIRILALLLLENPSLNLNIVTFQEQNRPTAKALALELKKQLSALAGKEVLPRIRLSWFGEAETLTTKTNTYHLAKGILLFGNNMMGTEKEKRT